EFFGSTKTVVRGHYFGKEVRWYDFWQANLKRKYGDAADWRERFVNATHDRLASWGFNTIGNWSDPDVYLKRKTPYTLPLASWGEKPLRGGEGYWKKFADVFDPSFRKGLEKAISDQVGKTTTDPWCIGYFVDNELSWDEETT